MADPEQAREQFCTIAGVSSATEADHYLEAVNYNVERAIDLFYSNPPPSSSRQEGAEVVDMTENDADAATAAALYEEDLRRLQEEPPPASRFEGLTEPSPQAAGNPPGPAQPSRVEIPSDDDDEPRIRGGEDEEGDMLNTMAAQRRQSVAAAERAQHAREASGGTTRQGMGTSSIFEGLPNALPTMFPGLHAPFPDPFGFPGFRAAAQARRRNMSTDMDLEDEDMDLEDAGFEEGRRRGTVRQIPVQTPGQDVPGEDPDAALARRLMEEEEAMAMPRPASTGPGPREPGQEEGDPQAADLHRAFDRHELEEARMLEASMLGIPYEPRLPPRGTTSSSAAASSLHPEVGAQRSLRHEQDQAYEESLAADRAKEEAAQMAAKKAEAEAKQAQEEAEASERAAAEEDNRVKAALSRKAASLAPEPGPGEPETVTIMVRWPDGTRQARRFRQQEPLQAVFDYVDTQHQGASVKPGTYNLVNSYPRKAFSEGTPGTLADVGITSNTSLFLEPKT